MHRKSISIAVMLFVAAFASGSCLSTDSPEVSTAVITNSPNIPSGFVTISDGKFMLDKLPGTVFTIGDNAYNEGLYI